jgi:hypothetical protein
VNEVVVSSSFYSRFPTRLHNPRVSSLTLDIGIPRASVDFLEMDLLHVAYHFDHPRQVCGLFPDLVSQLRSEFEKEEEFIECADRFVWRKGEARKSREEGLKPRHGVGIELKEMRLLFGVMVGRMATVEHSDRVHESITEVLIREAEVTLGDFKIVGVSVLWVKSTEGGDFYKEVRSRVGFIYHIVQN